MTYKTIQNAVAAASILALSSTAAMAANCSINMPDPQGVESVASANASLRAVLSSEYGIDAPVPSGGETVTVNVPNCNPADFANSGATVANVGGDTGLPGGAGAVGTGTMVGAGIGALVLVGVLLNDDDSSSTTTTGSE